MPPKLKQFLKTIPPERKRAILVLANIVADDPLGRPRAELIGAARATALRNILMADLYGKQQKTNAKILGKGEGRKIQPRPRRA